MADFLSSKFVDDDGLALFFLVFETTLHFHVRITSSEYLSTLSILGLS